MYRFAKVAATISSQAARQVRHGSALPHGFHSKYGMGLMVGGTVFCVGIWGYVLTQTGITWNVSPVGRMMPKDWRKAEE